MRNLKPKIIVVDDSEFCRDTTRLMLEEAGFDVITLATPQSFGRTLIKEKPDLALVDVSMPDITGDRLVTLTQRLVAERRCPIVLFSDLPEEKLSTIATACGAAGWIKKSVDWPSIIKSLKTYGQLSA